MTKDEMKLKTIPFNLHIPNLDGDGIAYTVPIEVQAYTDGQCAGGIRIPFGQTAAEVVRMPHPNAWISKERRRGEIEAAVGRLQTAIGGALRGGPARPEG